MPLKGLFILLVLVAATTSKKKRVYIRVANVSDEVKTGGLIRVAVYELKFNSNPSVF